MQFSPGCHFGRPPYVMDACQAGCGGAGTGFPQIAFAGGMGMGSCAIGSCGCGSGDQTLEPPLMLFNWGQQQVLGENQHQNLFQPFGQLRTLPIIIISSSILLSN
jgi:hypothetical protein